MDIGYNVWSFGSNRFVNYLYVGERTLVSNEELESIKGAKISRLTLQFKSLDFEKLNHALTQSEVQEIEFNATSTHAEAVKFPENLKDLTELNKINSIRLISQWFSKEELNKIVSCFGRQITALDLTHGSDLKCKDLDLLTKCPKLSSLSLFHCRKLSSEENPCSNELVESLTKVVKSTPVKHIVLGWDNDPGDIFPLGPDPRNLIPSLQLESTLSVAAGREIKITVTNWYPTSQMMDDHS